MLHKKTATDPEALGKKLGRAIAERRKALGLTQDDLAGLIEVDSVTVSRFETGVSTPSLHRLLVIANAIDTGVGELLSGVSSVPGDQAAQLVATMRELDAKDRQFLVDVAALLKKR